MKNENLWKVLGITLLSIILLTWIIPTSNFDGIAINRGQVTPTGYWDIFGSIGIAISYFWQPGVFILFVGGFYGVANKTGATKSLVDKLKKGFKGREKKFLIFSIAFFMITASLTAIYLPLFIFVPLFMAVILSMGYSKMVALLCTVGSIIIGSISLMYNTALYQALQVDIVPNVWHKLLLLNLSLAITIFYVWKTAEIKKGKQKEEIDAAMLFIESEKESKSFKNAALPLFITFIVLFVLFVTAMIPWTAMLGVEVFSNFYEAVMGVEIIGFPIFQNILGETLPPFGYWTTSDLLGLIFLAVIVLALTYKLKLQETIESFVDGAKKVGPTALLVVLINIAIVFSLNSGFYTTIMNYLVTLTEGLNVLTMSINTFLGSVLVVDRVYMANYIMSISNSILPADAPVFLLTLIGQTMYGTAMLIAPTSVVLLAGLSYLEVPYTSWVKYI